MWRATLGLLLWLLLPQWAELRTGSSGFKNERQRARFVLPGGIAATWPAMARTHLGFEEQRSVVGSDVAKTGSPLRRFMNADADR